MNLAQMRVAVRDILTAGGGTNIDTSIDEFWNDSEINLAINRAQDEVYKVIRRARSDFFTRILKSTDPAFAHAEHIYTPSTQLKLQAGVGEYTLPPQFVRMKLVSDLSANPARFVAADVAKHEFRILLQEEAGENATTFYYDIIGAKTMLVRPVPLSDRDIMIIFEQNLARLRDFTKGTVTTIYGNTTMTFSASAEINLSFFPGMEVIVNDTKPDPNIDYPVIKSVDSATQVTLERNYYGPSAANVNHITSIATPIPRHHHQMLVCLAASYCFNKGTNPHKDSAAIWRAEYDSMVPALVNDVESRQGSDPETVEAYLEGDLYD